MKLAGTGQRIHCTKIHSGRLSHRRPRLVGKRPLHYRHVTRQCFWLADPVDMTLLRFAIPKHTNMNNARQKALE